MRTTSMARTIGIAAVLAVVVSAQERDYQPTCNMCPGTYVPLAELDAYTKKAIAEKLLDQPSREFRCMASCLPSEQLTQVFAVTSG